VNADSQLRMHLIQAIGDAIPYASSLLFNMCFPLIFGEKFAPIFLHALFFL
jgi:hypothetical protein